MSIPDRPSAQRLSRRSLLGTMRSQVTFEQSVRVMLAMGGPIMIGVAFGRPDLGSLASIGTLTAPSVGNWTYPQRARRLSGQALLAGLAFVLGAVAADQPLVAVVVLGVWCALAMMVAGLVGDWAGPFATVTGVSCILAIWLDHGAAPWQGGALVALGGLWTAAVYCLGWLRHRFEPQVRAVGDGFSATARYLEAIGTPQSDAARIEARAAVLSGWDALGDPAGADDPRRQRLIGLLGMAQQLLDAADSVAFAATVEVPQDLPPAVHAVSFAVGDERLAGLLTIPEPPADTNRRVGACYQLAHRARALAAGWEADPHLQVRPLRVTLQDKLQGMGPVRAVYLSVGSRTGIAVAAAALAAQSLATGHAYWIAITVLIVMRPDRSGTYLIAAQRTLGTALGVLVSGTLLLAEPSPAAAALGMCVVTYLYPAAQERSFLLGSAMRSTHALLLIEAGNPGSFTVDVLAERVVATMAGALLAIVAVRVLWPAAATRRLPAAVQACLRAERSALTSAAAGLGPGDRQALLTDMFNLRALYAQSLGEPERKWPDRDTFWPVVVLTLRAGVTLRAAAYAPDTGATQPMLSVEGAAELGAALQDIGAAVAAGKPPPPLPWQQGSRSWGVFDIAEQLHAAATRATAPGAAAV